MKKINLNSAAFLGLGVFLLLTPALSQAIITSLVTAFFRDIDLLLWVNLAQNFWILNLIPKVVGATLVAGFAWKHLKTRFKVDLPKIKVQTTRLATYSLLFMLCAGLFLFADVPVSEAATTATTGYILDTPVSEHAWLIGAYSDGTYYAINGGTWDNMVAGVGSTAWATYKTNSTALTAQVLAVCTSGTIYMKDVAFDMNLFDDIPEDVRVICSYNAEYWEYINSADSSGSPYTVSVGSGVNVGYYLAADSEGRICFTSTNATTVFNSVFAVAKDVYISAGTYSITNNITVPSGITIRGAGANSTFLKATAPNISVLKCVGSYGNMISVTMSDFMIDGNYQTGITGMEFENVGYTVNLQRITLENSTTGTGIWLKGGNQFWYMNSLRIYNWQYGLRFSEGAPYLYNGFLTAELCSIIYNDYGVYATGNPSFGSVVFSHSDISSNAIDGVYIDITSGAVSFKDQTAFENNNAGNAINIQSASKVVIDDVDIINGYKGINLGNFSQSKRVTDFEINGLRTAVSTGYSINLDYIIADGAITNSVFSGDLATEHITINTVGKPITLSTSRYTAGSMFSDYTKFIVSNVPQIKLYYSETVYLGSGDTNRTINLAIKPNVVIVNSMGAIDPKPYVATWEETKCTKDYITVTTTGSGYYTIIAYYDPRNDPV